MDLTRGSHMFNRSRSLKSRPEWGSESKCPADVGELLELAEELPAHINYMNHILKSVEQIC